MEDSKKFETKLAEFLKERFKFDDSINKLVGMTVTFEIDGKIRHSQILSVTEVTMEDEPDPNVYVKIANRGGPTKNFSLMIEVANQVSLKNNTTRNRVLYILALENYRECKTLTENDDLDTEPSTRLSNKKQITIHKIN